MRTVGGDQDHFLRLATTQVCGGVPGARANLWQLGYYYLVLSQQQWQLCGGHVIPEAHKQLGLAYFCSSEVTHVGGDQSGSQAVAKLAETEPEPSCQMGVCALRLAQRRTPDSHRRPPSPLCNSRMI